MEKKKPRSTLCPDYWVCRSTSQYEYIPKLVNTSSGEKKEGGGRRGSGGAYSFHAWP